MTTPASGPLKFSDIQTEFGGTPPIAFSEYYGVGSPVPTNLGVPAAGQIPLSSFRGITNYSTQYLAATGINTGTGSQIASGWVPNQNGYGPYPVRTIPALTLTTTIPISTLTIYQRAFLDYGYNLFIGINGVYNQTPIAFIGHDPGGQGYTEATSTVTYAIAAGSVVTWAFCTGPSWQQILSDGTAAIRYNK